MSVEFSQWERQRHSWRQQPFHPACRSTLWLILLPLAHRLLVLAMDHVSVDIERGADATVGHPDGEDLLEVQTGTPWKRGRGGETF